MEYNPVAYLILKATVEYPQRYGHQLVSEVKRWGEWVLEQARSELSAFYPPLPVGEGPGVRSSGETPIAYIWSRTIRCPNPACGAEIPLFRQFWLARKDNKKVALQPIPSRSEKRVDFAIVEGKRIDFDPSKGTVSRGNAVCLVCNTSVKDDYVKAEAQAGRMGHRLVAVVTTRGRGQGRNYRLATEADLAAFRKAEEALQGAACKRPPPGPSTSPGCRRSLFRAMIGGQGSSQYRQRSRQNTAAEVWGQLFNPRQLLALVHLWQVGAGGAPRDPPPDPRPRLRPSRGDVSGVGGGFCGEL
ncbi:MAG: hypothetical protein KatS3mg022_0697 [Armatimonadota bacterium]|nr:MAG: hypothetical protein KatS3mg022_0697 [Armatimonadota bacterium]